MIVLIRMVIVTGLVVITIGGERKVSDAIETTRMTGIGGFVGKKTAKAASKIEMAESTRVSAVQNAVEEAAEAEKAEIDLGTGTIRGERETSGKFVCF